MLQGVMIRRKLRGLIERIQWKWCVPVYVLGDEGFCHGDDAVSTSICLGLVEDSIRCWRRKYMFCVVIQSREPFLLQQSRNFHTL